MLGYIPVGATASQFKQVFKLIAPQETDFVVPKGTVVRTEETSTEDSIYFEVAEDHIIPSGKLGDERDTDGNFLYLATVVQGETVSDDFIGSSNATPGQTFKLSYTHAIQDTVDVYVNNGSGWTLWEKVDSFIDSDNTSKVYSVSTDEANNTYIKFGDGVFGMIPTQMSNNILADYRVGR
jgi:predicted RNA-binding protein